MGIVDDLNQTYDDIMSAIDGLAEEEMSASNTVGVWAVRNVLEHIAMWEGEVIKALSFWRAGQEIDWAYVNGMTGINEFNAAWIENLKHMSVEKVLKLFEQTHKSLVSDIESIPEQTWTDRGGVPKWIPEITVDHRRHHMKGIKGYREAHDK